MSIRDSLAFEVNLPADEYTSFCADHPLGSILQSPPWALVKMEWSSLLVGLRKADGSLAAACQILIRPLALSFSFWYIPHGPLLDYEEDGVLETLLTHISALARKKRCLLVRVHPPCPIRTGSMADFREGKSREAFPLEELDRRFLSCRYIPGIRSTRMADTIQPRFQAVVYKENRPQEAEGKVRYQLRLNERLHVSVIRTGEEGLDAFSALIAKTESRQKIRLRGRDYFSRILQAFGEDACLLLAHLDLDQAAEDASERERKIRSELDALAESSPKKRRGLEEQLQSARKDLDFLSSLKKEENEGGRGMPPDFTGRLFMSQPKARPHLPAGALVVRCGRRAEMPYACSDERYGRVPSVWKLYAEGIRLAFAHGCSRYVLGGLEGSLDDGLSTFKSHFDPVIEETAGEYDFSVRPFACKVLTALMRQRRKKLLRTQQRSP